RYAKTIAMPESFGHKRSGAEVRQKRTSRGVVRVAYTVAVLDRLAGEFTSAGHFALTSNIWFLRPRHECPIHAIKADKQCSLMLLARDLGQAAYWESRVSIVTTAIAVKPDSKLTP